MKIINYILLSILLMTGVSCNFLDTEPNDFIRPQDFYKDSNDALLALTGIYSTLGSQNLYGEAYMQLFGTDDLTYYDRNTLPINVPNNNFDAGNNEVANVWAQLYTGINNANIFLERIEKTSMDAGTKKTYIGEATFLRAYFYFLLAQSWGDVPLITRAQYDENNLIRDCAATKQASVLAWVTSEMEKAEPMVAEIEAVEGGHVNKSAVRGILARVYLKRAGWPVNEGKPMYEKARYWAGEVIRYDKIKHDLNPDYTQVFKNLAADVADTKECLWEIYFTGNRLDGHQAAGRWGCTMGIKNNDVSKKSMGYSYAFYSVTLNLWDLFNDIDADGIPDLDDVTEKNNPDVRRDWNIAPYRYQQRNDNSTIFWKRYWYYKGDIKLDNNGNVLMKDDGVTPQTSGYGEYVQRNVGKYRREYEVVSPRDKNYTPINFPVLRYSDVLLMYAEADNEVEGSPSNKAVEYVKRVRKRAGLETKDSWSYEEFKRLIRDERARELCFEGVRKFDLLRWDYFTEEMNNVYRYVMNDSRWASGKSFAEYYAQNAASSERYKWLPIPIHELSLNHSLKQNPAW